MNRTLVIIVAIALVVAGVATIFFTGSDTTIPIPKPGNISGSSSSISNKDRNTNSEDLHNNNNTGLKSSLNH